MSCSWLYGKFFEFFTIEDNVYCGSVLYIFYYIEVCSMATYSSTLAWRIPWTEEPGGLPSMGSHRVGHDWSNLAAVAAAYSFYACFLKGFYHNVCLILLKAFSVIIEIIIFFLFFNLLMWCIRLIDLSILKNSCIPGIKPTWSWCMIFWNFGFCL